MPQHLKQAKEGCRVMVPFGFSTVVVKVILALEQTEDDENEVVVTVLDEAPFSHLNF
ncbi:MAG: hypothetical protein ACLSCV_03205 [Acutalibacteraceae bacterium]